MRMNSPAAGRVNMNVAFCTNDLGNECLGGIMSQGAARIEWPSLSVPESKCVHLRSALALLRTRGQIDASPTLIVA
jgi:hypothetical protein